MSEEAKFGGENLLIEVDLEKINAPLELDDYSSESPESYEQLRKHILYFEESSILISGYRGVGKTTMIQMLEDAIINKNNNFETNTGLIQEINKEKNLQKK